VNILDENVPESQRLLLRSRRVAVRQIGLDMGRTGMTDDEIIPLLHQLNRPTFFTLDADFCDRRLCHEGYCLVHLDIEVSHHFGRAFLGPSLKPSRRPVDALTFAQRFQTCFGFQFARLDTVYGPVP
jgi:hypothetical protein